MKVLFVTSEWPFDDQPYRAPFVKELTIAISKQLPGLEVLPFRLKRNPIKLVHARLAVKKALAEGVDHIHAFGLNSLFLVPEKWFPKTSVSLIGSDVYGVVGSDGRYSKAGSLPMFFFQSRLKNLAGIRTVSQALMNKVESRLRPNQPKLVLTNGMNFKNFGPLSMDDARSSLGWSTDRTHLFFPSNKERPVKNFELARELFAALETMVDEKLELHLPPMGKQEEMNAYYRAADITLLTSLHEGSPNVVKESLWCGTPVFSTPVGDVAEHLAATGYGVTFQPTDDLTTNAKRLTEWMGFKRGNPNNISEYCSSQFDVDTIATSMIDFWISI